VAGQAHDPEIVLSLLDRSKIQLADDGSIKAGLDDQLKALRETKPFLFKEQQQSGPVIKGAKPAEGSDKPAGGKPATDQATEFGKRVAQFAKQNAQALEAQKNYFGG